MKCLRPAMVVLVAATLCACASRPPLLRATLIEAGSVWVYVKPFPQEASPLSVRLEEVSAIRDDGQAVRLTTVLTDLSVATLERTRLLAWGDVPPGVYTGLAFRVRAASLRADAGVGALQVDEEATPVRIGLTIEPRQAVVVSLDLRYREAVTEDSRFVPAFSAVVPGKLATGLIGLVSSRGSNTVSVFDKVSGDVVAVVPTGKAPAGLALDEERRRAYVAVSGEDAVEVIDLLENTIIGRVQLTTGDEPVSLTLTQRGETLLSANAGSGTVSVIDPVSFFERDRIRVGNGPRFVLSDRQGRRAYVFNTLSNSISVLSLPNVNVIGSIVTEAGPFRGQFNRAGDRLYVAHGGSSFVAVVDPATQAIERRVNVGLRATAIKADTRTDRLYVARANADAVDVYDPLSLLPTDTITVAGTAEFLAIDGERNVLCIVLSERNELRLVRIVGKETVARIDVGLRPSEVVLFGQR